MALACNDLIARPTHPILHLQAGVFFVNKTIRIPAGCEIHIIGDGMGTRIEWGKAVAQTYGAGPGLSATQEGFIFTLEAPARATIRDLMLGAHLYTTQQKGVANASPKAPVGRGILIRTKDTPGDRVYMDKVSVAAAQNPYPGTDDFTHAITVEGNHVSTRLDSVGLSNAAFGLNVDGGGQATTGVRVYGGSSGGISRSTYSVKSGGKLVVHGVEDEQTVGINLDGGSGSFTFVGTRYGANNPTPYAPCTIAATCPAPPSPGSPSLLWLAWRDQLSSPGGLNHGAALYAGDFHGTISLLGVHVGMTLIRDATSVQDLTFAFGVHYNYSGNTDACSYPIDPGLWPDGLAPQVTDLVESANTCTPAFNVTGGASYVAGSLVAKGALLAPKPGCVNPRFGRQERACAPPAANSYVPAMLADLRAAKIETIAPACLRTNTDAHIEHVLFQGFDAHMGIYVQKVP
jgi:hypothetical protein